jgi:hypothetical protein
MSRLLAALLLVLLATPAGLLARRDEPRRVGTDVGGYALYKKVVVVRGGARLFEKLDDFPKVGKRLPVFSIFYRLETAKSDADKGLVRVGTFDGKSLGWVEMKHMQEWNTRFVLEPIRPQADRTFVFRTRVKDREEEVALDALPEKGTHRCYGFVLEKPDETKDEDDAVYKLFVSTGAQADSAGNVEVPNEEETKLEIVFVLESSDFMNKRYGDDKKRLLDHLQDVVKLIAGEIGRDPELAKAVRLGFVQYWDNVGWRAGDRRLERDPGLSAGEKKAIEARLRASSPLFPAHLTCDLTDDPKKFSDGIMKLKATDLHDDWADDVIAGLNEAVRKAKWSKNSLKHVILIGSAACQLDAEGVNVSQDRPGKDNSFTREDAKGPPLPRGFNSTGMSIQELLDRAQPGAGGTSVDLSHRFFHALFLPNERIDFARRCPKLTPEKLERFRKHLADVVNEKDEVKVKALRSKLTKDLQAEVGSAREAASYLSTLLRAHRIDYQSSLARAHYRELTKSRSGGQGIFREVDPSAADVEKASRELAKKLIAALRAIKALRAGGDVGRPRDNPLVLPTWRLREDIRKEFQKAPVALGTAKVRDDLCREIAARKIMVSRREMERVAGLLRDWHERFKKLGANRKNPDDILRELQESLGKQGYGQLDLKDGEGKARLKETTLEKMLRDLPMRSPALQAKPEDIRRMDDEKFAKWLKRIEEAAQRCQKHLDDSDAWALLTEGAVPGDDKYGFFLLSMMP